MCLCVAPLRFFDVAFASGSGSGSSEALLFSASASCGTTLLSAALELGGSLSVGLAVALDFFGRHVGQLSKAGWEK
jgi:hypothetical protein